MSLGFAFVFHFAGTTASSFLNLILRHIVPLYHFDLVDDLKSVLVTATRGNMAIRVAGI